MRPPRAHPLASEGILASWGPGSSPGRCFKDMEVALPSPPGHLSTRSAGPAGVHLQPRGVKARGTIGATWQVTDIGREPSGAIGEKCAMSPPRPPPHPSPKNFPVTSRRGGCGGTLALGDTPSRVFTVPPALASKTGNVWFPSALPTAQRSSVTQILRPKVGT